MNILLYNMLLLFHQALHFLHYNFTIHNDQRISPENTAIHFATAPFSSITILCYQFSSLLLSEQFSIIFSSILYSFVFHKYHRGSTKRDVSTIHMMDSYRELIFQFLNSHAKSLFNCSLTSFIILRSVIRIVKSKPRLLFPIMARSELKCGFHLYLRSKRNLNFVNPKAALTSRHVCIINRNHLHSFSCFNSIYQINQYFLRISINITFSHQ